MLRTSRWWARELERRERQWAAERAQLVSTICRLAGRPSAAPLPPVEAFVLEEDDPDEEADLVQPDFL